MTAITRITIDPAICHGQPVIRGLRYPVEWVLSLLSGGTTTDELLGDCPDLERDNIFAALAFGAKLARIQRIEPMPA